MATSIADRVRLSPLVSDREPLYLDQVVERVKDWLAGELNMPEGIEKARGYSRSGADAATDITGLATNTLRVSVNGSAYAVIVLTLSGLTTGEAIRSHLESKIQAFGDAYGEYAEVTVAFDSDKKQYTIESGQYGPHSAIKVSWDVKQQAVARALKLSETYGGDERPGAFDHPQAQSLAVRIAERWFRQTEIEGFSDRVPSEAVLLQFAEMNADIRQAIIDLRRL